LRLGLRPRQWEKYSPAEIYLMEDAAAFNRSRDLEAWAVGVAAIANRIPLVQEGVVPQDLLKRVYGYEALPEPPKVKD